MLIEIETMGFKVCVGCKGVRRVKFYDVKKKIYNVRDTDTEINNHKSGQCQIGVK